MISADSIKAKLKNQAKQQTGRLFQDEFSRATRDIDLLAYALNNEVEVMTKVLM